MYCIFKQADFTEEGWNQFQLTGNFHEQQLTYNQQIYFKLANHAYFSDKAQFRGVDELRRIK